MASHATDVANAAGSGLFKVTGTWHALVDPSVSGSWSMPEVINVQGLVTFTPRLPSGSLLYTEEAVGFALAPRYARIWNGELSTINVTDSKDVYLQANTPDLNLLDSVGLTELIYDVVFSKVTFGGKPVLYETLPDGSPAPSVRVTGAQAVTPFAFVAPTDPSETICLTDVGLKRLPWSKKPGKQAPVG